MKLWIHQRSVIPQDRPQWGGKAHVCLNNPIF
jgi:hypothetical protein